MGWGKGGLLIPGRSFFSFQMLKIIVNLEVEISGFRYTNETVDLRDLPCKRYRVGTKNNCPPGQLNKQISQKFPPSPRTC